MGTIAFKTFGKPEDVLTMSSETPFGAPTAGQLKVTISANQVSAEDIKMIRGVSMINTKVGVAGTTGTGVISGVPSGETDFKLNDPVLIIGGEGTWSSSVVVSKSSVVKIPKMSVEEAACLPAAITAYALLNNITTLTKGDAVLHTEGASLVGQAINAISKSMGITVIAPSAADLAKAGYSKTVADKNIKLAITSLYGKPPSEVVKSLTHGGVLVTCTGSSEVEACQPLTLNLSTAAFIFQNVTVCGFDLTAFSKSDPAAYTKAVSEVAAMVGSKKLTLKPSATFPQKEFLKAIKAADAGAVLTL